MKKINKFLKRLSFYTFRGVLRFVDYFDPRLFMVLYASLLKANGVIFSGVPRYISTKVRFDDFSLIKIGDKVVMSENVILLTHDYSYTAALHSINESPEKDIAFISGISIGNNVFIGMNAVILPGARIGNDVVIGAGSIVRGVIPDNSVVVGNPGVNIGTLTSFAEKWKSKLGEKEIRMD